jgi:hypothetical protein
MKKTGYKMSSPLSLCARLRQAHRSTRDGQVTLRIRVNDIAMVRVTIIRYSPLFTLAGKPSHHPG